MNLDIKGKRALVCAASRGMGKAIAKSLSREGVQLFICARNSTSLESTAKEIKEYAEEPVYYQACDLTSRHSINELIDKVKSSMGEIDILVHNVGGPPFSTVLETKLEDWSLAYRQLFESVVQLNQAFLPEMKEKRWGRIVAVTSLSVAEPIPTLAMSNAMRSAVTSMLKTLADEVASYNICINCVAPGLVHTQRTEERLQIDVKQTGRSRDELLVQLSKSIPAQRLGSPEEFASVVTFLCSQPASYITGSTIYVDGGKRRSTY